VDKAWLEYEMAVRQITAVELCRQLGMSRSAYYRKCSGQSEFTCEEIQQIMDYVGLETPMGIFFRPPDETKKKPQTGGSV
jgi:hypothetical protein